MIIFCEQMFCYSNVYGNIVYYEWCLVDVKNDNNDYQKYDDEDVVFFFLFFSLLLFDV